MGATVRSSCGGWSLDGGAAFALDRPMHVIVGAGIAGAAAAESLRRHGYRGAITLVGDENEAPYYRPFLSREYLDGESVAQHRLALGEATEELRYVRGTAAIGINPQSRTVVLSTDEVLHYERLLIATGARPRSLDIEGSTLDGVFSLRQLGDAERMRQAFQRSSSVLVVGGGPLGLDIASAALRAGKQKVALVESERVPLSTAVPTVIGASVRHYLQSCGLQCSMETSVLHLVGQDRVEAAVLSSGALIDCDLVFVAIGTRAELPPIRGVHSSGRAMEVDSLMRTSLPDIYCAGEAACVRDTQGKFRSARTYYEAYAQGWTAGAAMADDVRRPYRHEYHFRASYCEGGVRAFGAFAPDDEVVLRGDLMSRVAFALRDGVLVGAGTFRRDGEAIVLADVPYGSLSPTKDMLADPAFDLATLTSQRR